MSHFRSSIELLTKELHYCPDAKIPGMTGLIVSYLSGIGSQGSHLDFCHLSRHVGTAGFHGIIVSVIDEI